MRFLVDSHNKFGCIGEENDLFSLLGLESRIVQPIA
jgi:hypothetical protein